MSNMMLKMLADMAGITPEKLGAEIEGFATLAKESREALARIETNTQENGRMLRELLATKGQTDDRRNDGDSHDGGSGHPSLPGL